MGTKTLETFDDLDSDDEPDFDVHDEGQNLSSSIPKGITNVSITNKGLKKKEEKSAEKPQND